MSVEENRKILQHVYSRWDETKGGSVDELFELFDDDVKFRSLADGSEHVAFTAPISGKAELRRYFDGLLSGWTMHHYTIHTIFGEGEHIAAIGRMAWTNKATGKQVETPKVDIWRFSDGKATEFTEYYDTAMIYAAAVP